MCRIKFGRRVNQAFALFCVWHFRFAVVIVTQSFSRRVDMFTRWVKMIMVSWDWGIKSERVSCFTFFSLFYSIVFYSTSTFSFLISHIVDSWFRAKVFILHGDSFDDYFVFPGEPSVRSRIDNSRGSLRGRWRVALCRRHSSGTDICLGKRGLRPGWTSLS